MMENMLSEAEANDDEVRNFLVKLADKLHGYAERADLRTLHIEVLDERPLSDDDTPVQTGPHVFTLRIKDSSRVGQKV